MYRLALGVALLATPLTAQQLVIDSTFNVYSKTARVTITSEPFPTDLPGLDMYVAAHVEVSPSDDPAYRYATVCRTWVAFRQSEPGRYWRTSRIPAGLLVRKPAREPASRATLVVDSAVSVPLREQPGDLAFRWTSPRQSGIEVTAQVHTDAGHPFLVVFPGAFFDVCRAVLARADSPLLKASRANRTREVCR
jgi:hypothetical protein